MMRFVTLRKTMVVLVLILAVACWTTEASAAVVYTSGNSDGLSGRYWDGGVDTWTTLDGATLSGYYDGSFRMWEMPVFQFPISQFTAGDVTSATVNLYCYGTGGTVDFRYYGAGNGTVQYSQATSAVQTIESFSVGEGWKSFTVTSQLLTALNNGYDWIVFNVNIGNGESASFAASEAGASLCPSMTVVPEPMTLGLLALGGMAMFRRRHA